MVSMKEQYIEMMERAKNSLNYWMEERERLKARIKSIEKAEYYDWFTYQLYLQEKKELPELKEQLKEAKNAIRRERNWIKKLEKWIEEK